MSMVHDQGLVLKGVGGLYTVAVEDRTVECRACGRFRRERITPLAGDRVTVEFQEDGSGFLTEILPRRNVLVRPPVANLDLLVIVASAAQPAPNTLVMDKLIAVAEKNEIEPVVVVNKTDLADARTLQETYRKSGFPTFPPGQGAGVQRQTDSTPFALPRGGYPFCARTHRPAAGVRSSGYLCRRV